MLLDEYNEMQEKYTNALNDITNKMLTHINENILPIWNSLVHEYKFGKTMQEIGPDNYWIFTEDGDFSYQIVDSIGCVCGNFTIPKEFFMDDYEKIIHEKFNKWSEKRKEELEAIKQKEIDRKAARARILRGELSDV